MTKIVKVRCLSESVKDRSLQLRAEIQRDERKILNGSGVGTRRTGAL